MNMVPKPLLPFPQPRLCPWGWSLHQSSCLEILTRQKDIVILLLDGLHLPQPRNKHDLLCWSRSPNLNLFTKDMQELNTIHRCLRQGKLDYTGSRHTTQSKQLAMHCCLKYACCSIFSNNCPCVGSASLPPPI